MLEGGGHRVQALGLGQGGSQILFASIVKHNVSSSSCPARSQLGQKRHYGCLFNRNGVRTVPSLTTSAEASRLRRRHLGAGNGRRRRAEGPVWCAESNVTETFSEAGIEVLKSLEEAENESLRAVSGNDKGGDGTASNLTNSPQANFEAGDNDSIHEDEIVNPAQAAFEESLAEEERAETVQFHSMEPDAVMAAAAKVAEALGEPEVEEQNVGQVYFHLLEPASAVAAAVMVTDFSETLEEAVQEEAAVAEEQNIGFMLHIEAPPEVHTPPPEAALLEELLKAPESPVVEEQVVVEENPHLLEPGAVAAALMVKEVADALRAPEEDPLAHVLEKEADVSQAQEGEDKNMIEQLKEIIIFAGPALGIWLSGPIMSLIDTAVIGNSSSLELAALGPGTVLCDQVCYIFMFLSVATSNLIATSLAHKDKEEAAHHLSRMLFLALACGIGLLVVTELWVTQLLQAFVGAQNYDLIPAARVYVQIRALAWPAVLVSLVSQSASLGMMDSTSPLKVLAVGSLVNLFGDIFLCSFLGYGIAGAAWATIVSQYVAGILMALSLGTKGYNSLDVKAPSFKELGDIAKLTAPLLLTMISKVSFYTLITYLATSLGAITVAAHQVMVGIYGLCAVWGEPLAQTAQSFMPPLMYGAHRNLKQARKLLQQLLLIGVVVGTAIGGLAVSIPWICPQVFTSDSAIISQMRGVTLPFLVSMISCPPTLSLEGTLLAGRDFKFLGLCMTTCFIGGTFMLVASKVFGYGLQGSWWTLAAFQWARFVLSYVRLNSSKSILADPAEGVTHAKAA